MSVGLIMMGIGGLLLFIGILRWIIFLARGKKEKRQMELRMREKY